MIDLARHVWPALAAAFVLGLAFGGLSRAVNGMKPAQARVSLGILVAALTALGLSAAFDLVPGRSGLWLDSALLHLVAYLAGCALGWLMARFRAGRRVATKEAG